MNIGYCNGWHGVTFNPGPITCFVWRVAHEGDPGFIDAAIRLAAEDGERGCSNPRTVAAGGISGAEQLYLAYTTPLGTLMPSQQNAKEKR